jgi:hypothetical protein
MSFLVRTAQANDYNQIRNLYAILDDHHRIHRHDLFHPPPSSFRDETWLANILADNSSQLLVAVSEIGEVLGLVEAYIRKYVCTLSILIDVIATSIAWL